jgi:hypothetical protein
MDPIAGPLLRTAALDKNEGVVKAQNPRAVFFAPRRCQREGGGPRLWKSHGESSSGERIVPSPIDTAETATMNLLSESRFGRVARALSDFELASAPVFILEGWGF